MNGSNLGRDARRPHVARVAACLTGVIAMLLASASPALAHIDLVSSSPRADQQVMSRPTEAVLRFNEPVAANFVQASVTVSGSPAQPVPARVSGTIVRVGLERVSTGTSPGSRSSWTLKYRVVSRDGHPVQGAVEFSVREPTKKDPRRGAPSTGNEARGGSTDAPAVGPDDPDDSSNVTSPLFLGGGVIALGGLALLVWWARRG